MAETCIHGQCTRIKPDGSIDGTSWGDCLCYGQQPLLQQRIAAWHRHNFPGTTVERQQLNLSEETGEVARAILKRLQGIRGTSEMWTEKLREEVGDVAISLYCIAVIEGFDFMLAVQERFAEIEQRDWVADSLGHGAPD